MEKSILIVVVCAALGLHASAQEAAKTSIVAAQNTETIKWKFNGNDAGTNTYQSYPDGRFESVTDLNVLGTALKSRITGKLVDGVITEFEAINQQGGMEVKVSAKGGKARITVGDNTREVEYKASNVLFGNIHPVFLGTLARALDPAKDGVQSIDVLMLDAAVTLKVDVTKKKARTIEAGGRKQIADVYFVHLPTVEFDIYVTEGFQLVAWDIPSQKLQAVRSGSEAFLVDTTTLHPELSQPVMKTKTEKGVKIKMRDGVELVADIVRPADDGKYPAILERTPYGRENFSKLSGEWWARRGYAHIAQDTRGRNESDGEWTPFVHERKDGYDTIDWIAGQSWSDGKVGMIGGSYGGWVQWAAAVEAHPALKCIAPQVSPPDLFFNFPIDHGVPMLWGALWWSNFVKDKKVPLIPEIPGNLEKLKTLPLSKVDDEVLGRNIPFYDDWLGKDTPAAFAGASYMADMNKVKIPVLHTSGWWDGDGIGTKLNWARMRDLGHKDQWLIYGPWSHAFNTSSRFGDLDYGSEAIIDLDLIYLRWFDTWLKNKPAQWDKQPKVRVFVTGANEWRELSDWPDPRSREMTLYLGSEGPANGPTSVGELVPTAPGEQEPDRYTYNPANVQIPNELKEVKNYFDLLAGRSTVVKIEPDQNGVLIYKTAPMKDSIEIGGPIDLDLYFSTSAKDTDFFASLVDIDEKGEMRVIGIPGKIRARYLSGWEKPTLLQPGKVYKAAIELWDTAHQVKKGHRLGVIINSQQFPGYARNLNTGEPIMNATRMVAAHQTIYHDAKRPSALRFRLLPQAQKQIAGSAK
ncbi:MAG TPA: CocE/NonD family hydrolase [Blastocatellia bacterium]